MKQTYLIIGFLILIFFSACLRPPEEESDNWLEDLIAAAENGTDTSRTQAIWSYEYNGQTVYYTLSLPGWDYNYVYDSSGTRLGAADGGWRNAGDENLEDFFDVAQSCSLVWYLEYPMVEGANEEYQIINQVLRTRFPDKPYLHLIETTHKALIESYARSRFAEGGLTYDSLMLGDYEIKNFESLVMNEDYLLEKVHTVPRNVLDNIWTNYNYPNDWQEYYRRYPNSCGVIEVSRPGFSTDGNTAIMGLGWQFSGDGGHGYFLILKKIETRWIVRWVFDTWIS